MITHLSCSSSSIMKPWLILCLALLFPCSSSPLDTLDPNNPLREGDVLVSDDRTFVLGFFSPGNSTRRYLGIWFYPVSEQTVVWVANRDAPLTDTSGHLAVDSTGNLNLYADRNGRDAPIWSGKVSNPTNDSVVRFVDSGNLVVLGEDRREVLWQSFDYPTDTLLPRMKLGLNRRTGSYWWLSSWKSADDPGTGSVTYRIDPTGYPQVVLYRRSSIIWRAGPWTGLRLSGLSGMSRDCIVNSSFTNDDDELSMSYKITHTGIPPVRARVYVDESGMLRNSMWNNHQQHWSDLLSTPHEQCENYGTCGANGNCDPYAPYSVTCKCLPGFEPNSSREWLSRDWSGGCVRKAGTSTCQRGEGFVKLTHQKLPDTTMARADMGMGLKACQDECLRNCSCVAYASAYERGIGCLRWYDGLEDTRVFADDGQDIYVRVNADVLAAYNKSRRSIFQGASIKAAMIVSVSSTIFLLVFLWFCHKRRQMRNALKRERKHVQFNFDTMIVSGEKGNSHLPLLTLSEIIVATDNFSDENKLGEGGFGSVYKGTYEGKEIAVKRLSRYSGQGDEEFKNEVEVIARLQHKNLVRILGCCVEGREKMLVYEYLPNKSLDYFLFDKDHKKAPPLDWPARYNIISGIARGIMYLHEDSRLRIIHRDLKASNVLLDASMNPKISDFGMARIFGANQNEGSTNRVVGTYGYMSPEYAMEGIFSVKSDVYSFGVLLLETVSGRKNTSYHEEPHPTSLVRYTWELWKQGRAMEIVDPSLGHSYHPKGVLRCIQIGLLCVQEMATDRPNMFDVVFMMCNVETTPPDPRKPAFILKKRFHGDDPSTSTTGGASSINDVTMTALEPR